MASATAAGSAYSTHGEHMIPFYIFYSMFGFQRTGDSIWAMADQLARGFLIGATAGRTTLTGEGLQHADGHSPLLAATNPAVVHYDPAFAYEVSHIMQSGLERMYGRAGPRTARTSSSTSPSTTSRSPSPRSRTTSTSRASSRASTTSRPAEGDGPRVQLLASGVGYPWIDRGRARCWPRSGACAPTPGRSRRGTSWPATPSPPRSGTSCTPASQPAHGVRHRASSPARPVRSWPCPTTCVPCRCRSRAGSPATTACWVPTASASPTPAPPPAASSTSTPQSVVVQALQALADAGEVAGGEGRRGRSRSYRIDDPTAVQRRQAGGRRRLTVRSRAVTSPQGSGPGCPSRSAPARAGESPASAWRRATSAPASSSSRQRSRS